MAQSKLLPMSPNTCNPCPRSVHPAGGVGRGPLGVAGLCRASPAAAPNAANVTNGGVGAAAGAEAAPTRPPPQAGEEFSGGYRHRFQSMIVGIRVARRPAMRMAAGGVSANRAPRRPPAAGSPLARGGLPRPSARAGLAPAVWPLPAVRRPRNSFIASARPLA